MILKSWRWFGEGDTVSLSDIRNIGIEGVVTALHNIPNGEVWDVKDILDVKTKIEQSGLKWVVVESLPVPEEVKYAGPGRDSLIENYCQSIINLGKCGIDTVCYNFMPVLDWARTDLEYRQKDGTETMYFDFPTFVAFDIFVLGRPGAEEDYPKELVEKSRRIAMKMSKQEGEKLAYNIIVKTQGFIDGAVDSGAADFKKTFLSYIDNYRGTGREQLRENLVYFLRKVIPVAEKAGVKMCIHPDDPPFSLLGLPRIVTDADDINFILESVPSIHNGITLCTGSLGVREDNDLPAIVRRFGNKIHFYHLRNTKRLENNSFFEAGHLDGDVNMAGVVKAIVEEQLRRKDEGRSDWLVPVRPDHGLKMLYDFEREDNPGYPLLGRLKGIAQLEGLAEGIFLSFKDKGK